MSNSASFPGDYFIVCCIDVLVLSFTIYFTVRETAPSGLILNIYVRMVMSPQKISWDI